MKINLSPVLVGGTLSAVIFAVSIHAETASAPATQPEAGPPPSAAASHDLMMRHMAGMMESVGGMMRDMAGDKAKAATEAKPMCACCDMMADKSDHAKEAAKPTVPSADVANPAAAQPDPHAAHTQH